MSFHVRIVPGRDAVNMEMSLRNGSTRTLKNARTQICVMLKGAPGFNAQTKENKVLTEREAAVAPDVSK